MNRYLVGFLLLFPLIGITIFSFFKCIWGLIFLIPIVFLSTYEIFRLCRFSNKKGFLLLINSLFLTPWILNYWPNYFWFGIVIVGLLLFTTITYFCSLEFVSICKESLSFRSQIMIAFLFWSSISYLVSVGDWKILVLLFLIAILSDIFGFMIGKSIGIHKCFKSSPNKTLEGFFGSLFLTSLICSLFFYLINKPFYYGTILGLIGSLIAISGDLFFSKQKRLFLVKDFGRSLGKHGGFWDRFDSHSFLFSFFIILEFFFLVVNKNLGISKILF